MIVGIEGVDNVRAISASLERSAQRIGAQAAAVVRRSAQDIQRLAKQNAPVDTGALRASISVSYAGDGRNSSMEAEIGPEAPYGIFLELGTSRMAPRPYLFPAADVVEPRYVAAMERLTDPFGNGDG